MTAHPADPLLHNLAGVIAAQQGAFEAAESHFQTTIRLAPKGPAAYENLGRFKGESSFYTWLYRIVVNLSIDFQRRERRHPTVALEDRGGMAADRDGAPVFLAKSQWELGYVTERHPNIAFAKTRERSDVHAEA